MAKIGRPKVADVRKPMHIRVPLDMADYLARTAIRNGSSQCAEVARAVRERMDREARAARRAS